MKIIDGKKLASEIRLNVKKHIEENYVSKSKQVPSLAYIIVEGNSASEVYVTSKEKACKECLMNSRIIRLKENISEEKLIEEINKLNKDNNISGILLQLPLPKHLNEDKCVNAIDPKKDVDALTYENLGKLFSKKQDIAPCTATGIMKILESENINIEGKKAVVVGRSLLVGKSVANLLEQKNATVTICHSRTLNLKSETKNADILIVAIGKPEFITKEYVKKGAVIIDVGINRTENGLKGDVNFESVKEHCSYITPVPGGVGPLTVACLMNNTLILHEKRMGK